MYLACVYTGQGAIFRRLTWPYPVTDYVHVTIDLLAFKSDFCHLLGLCIEGKSRSSSEPTLKWNSVYISGTLQAPGDIICDWRKVFG